MLMPQKHENPRRPGCGPRGLSCRILLDQFGGLAGGAAGAAASAGGAAGAVESAAGAAGAFASAAGAAAGAAESAAGAAAGAAGSWLLQATSASAATAAPRASLIFIDESPDNQKL
jgi:hypothetical protein